MILDEAGHIVDRAAAPDRSRRGLVRGQRGSAALVDHIAAALEGFDVTTTNRTDEVAALAIQGPEAFDVLAPLESTSTSRRSTTTGAGPMRRWLRCR